MFLRVLGMRLHKCCFWDFINTGQSVQGFQLKVLKLIMLYQNKMEVTKEKTKILMKLI